MTEDAVALRTRTNRVQKALAWAMLAAFLGITAVARGVYASQGVAPSARFRAVTLVGMIVLLWYWFSQQMAPHRPRLAMDMGVFILVLWFVLVPYYLWRYERWWGAMKAVCLLGLYVLSWLLAMVAYVALS